LSRPRYSADWVFSRSRRDVDLVLVEQEADLLLLGERRKEEIGEEQPDAGREAPP
jgi:hypothetical protein